jgi:predicted dehydrogenase
MSHHWRCAVVGTGLAGDWHVKTIPLLGNCTLAAVCEPNKTKAASSLEKARLLNVPIHTDVSEMLRTEKIDIVHIATPSGNHMPLAMQAMQAGKHVIVEKPMEIQVDRIDQMGEFAKKQGVRLAGIFQNRWNPANRAIKDAADAGRFGRFTWAGSFTPWYRTDQYYRDGGWRGTWKLDGGGAIMNQSVHAIDLLQWIVGPVKSVSAYASSRIHAEIEVEDTLSCALEFHNGGYGSIMGTTAMYPGQPARLEVGGEFGTAISENGLKFFKFKDDRPEDQDLRERFCPPPPEIWKARLAATGGDELLDKLGIKKATSTGGGASAADVATDLHLKNIRAILDAWEAGKEADTNPAEARKAVAIISAMYESAKRGGAAVEVR